MPSFFPVTRPDNQKRGSMTRRRILRSTRALVRNECPYYRTGKCMETGESCPARSATRDAPINGLMGCDQFMECVLPVGWDMNDLIDYALWYEGADSNPVKEDS